MLLVGGPWVHVVVDCLCKRSVISEESAALTLDDGLAVLVKVVHCKELSIKYAVETLQR